MAAKDLDIIPANRLKGWNLCCRLGLNEKILEKMQRPVLFVCSKPIHQLFKSRPRSIVLTLQKRVSLFFSFLIQI